MEDTGSMPTANAAAAPLDAEIEEVRLAMALNGGVSLSVWMGGVAVELDSARRAHTASEPSPAGGQRTVYNAILTALQRHLVVDIMCGASAGGLNGSLLAAAIRTGRRLNPEMLRPKWLDVGDFLQLLQPMNRRDPPDLMQGGSSRDDPGVFFAALRKMFAIVLGTPLLKGVPSHTSLFPAGSLKVRGKRSAFIEFAASSLVGVMNRSGAEGTCVGLAV